jgi:hypothetical protein
MRMGPVVPVVDRVVMVTDDGPAGQFGWLELAGLLTMGFWCSRWDSPSTTSS